LAPDAKAIWNSALPFICLAITTRPNSYLAQSKHLKTFLLCHEDRNLGRQEYTVENWHTSPTILNMIANRAKTAGMDHFIPL